MPTDDSNPWDAPDDDASPADDAPDAPAADAEPAPAAPAATTTAPPPADDGEPSPEDRRRVLIFAGVAFVVIALIAFALTRGGDDDDDPVAGGDTASTEPGGPAGGAVVIAGTADTFNREDTTDGLGALPSGAPWVVQSGGWAIQANEAVVTRPEEQKRNTVYVATGYPDPQAQVRLTKIANNAGLTFRFQGECNYWVVYAVPEFATWNVEKVIDCERIGAEEGSQVYRTITQAPVADGTTVGVVLRGDQVQIVLNGRVALTFEDPDLAGVGRLGLSTKGPAEVRFDDFIAGGPEGQGIIGGANAGPGGADPSTPADGSTTPPADGSAPPEDGSSTTPVGDDGG